MLSLVAVLTAVLLAPEPAITGAGCAQCEAPEYTVTDLGAPRGGRFPQAAGINARGDIVGSGGGGLLVPPNAFLLRNGVVIPLGGSSFGGAAAINGAGNVVGQIGNHAFFWDRKTGVLIDLGLGVGSAANGVNESGQVVGRSADHAFVWEDGAITDLVPLPGGTGSEALGINEIGLVVGWSTTNGANGQHAVFWRRNGGVRDLGTLGGPTSRAYAQRAQADRGSGDTLWASSTRSCGGTAS